MTRTLISVSLVTAFVVSIAQAAPIGAFSELEMTHSFTVNNGNVPSGVMISSIGNSFTFETGADSMVDDPVAIPSETSFFQVGNPFSDPPLPFISDRTDASQLPGGFEGAASGYEIVVTTEDDPRDDVFDITRRTVAQEGAASAILLDDTIAASAASFVRSSRNYVFTNTTEQLLSFNIAGHFDAILRAEYNGDNGLSRVAGGFELDFVGINGVSFNYFPVSPYLTTIEDSDPGSFVNQSFQENSGDTGRLTFNASASATGAGGTTLASLEASHAYVLGLSLDPNAQVLLRTSYTQANSVEHTPLGQVPPVPLPAGGLLLLTGMGAFAAIRKRSGQLGTHA